MGETTAEYSIKTTMSGTEATNRNKIGFIGDTFSLFPSTTTTAGAVDTSFDVSYYYTATVKHITERYVLFNGRD